MSVFVIPFSERQDLILGKCETHHLLPAPAFGAKRHGPYGDIFVCNAGEADGIVVVALVAERANLFEANGDVAEELSHDEKLVVADAGCSGRYISGEVVCELGKNGEVVLDLQTLSAKCSCLIRRCIAGNVLFGRFRSATVREG